MRKQFSSMLWLLLATGCGNPTAPCGTFTFNGSPYTPGGVFVTNSFAFNPSACGSSCTTNTIAFIQIIRIIDIETGEYLQPTSQQAARMVINAPSPPSGPPPTPVMTPVGVTGLVPSTLNGWAVDRIDGRVWGYYGGNNDGTFSSDDVTGSNSSPAVLTDNPYHWYANTRFDAIDVPVCIDPRSSCVNNLLGYYYWLWAVGENANAAGSAPFSEIGVTWTQQAAALAIAQWNATAPGVGKNVFPAFTNLP